MSVRGEDKGVTNTSAAAAVYTRASPIDDPAAHASPGALAETSLAESPQLSRPDEAASRSDNGLRRSDEDAVETFFSSGPPAPDLTDDAWVDLSGQHPLLDPDHHRARRLTVYMLAGALVVLAAFLLYHKVLMPTPEPLGQGTVALPTPQVMPQPAAEDPPVDQEEVAPIEERAEAEEPVEPPPIDEAQGGEPSAAGDQEPQAPAEAAAVEAAAVDSVGTAYADLVAEARRMGFRGGAEQTYVRALAVKPDGDEALSGLAMLLLNRGKNKLALERAQQAVTLNPESSEGWIVLGAARDAMGDQAGAREAYRDCVEKGKGRYVTECRRMVH